MSEHHVLDIVPISRHQVIDGLGDAMIVLDEQGRIVDLNPAAQQIFGCSLERASGRHAEDVYCPGPELSDLYHKTGEVRAEFSCAGDAKRYFDGYAWPLLDGQGNAMGRADVLRDITEHKGMENALRDSEQRFRLIANSSPEMIFETV